MVRVVSADKVVLLSVGVRQGWGGGSAREADGHEHVPVPRPGLALVLAAVAAVGGGGDERGPGGGGDGDPGAGRPCGGDGVQEPAGVAPDGDRGAVKVAADDFAPVGVAVAAGGQLRLPGGEGEGDGHVAGGDDRQPPDRVGQLGRGDDGGGGELAGDLGGHAGVFAAERQGGDHLAAAAEPGQHRHAVRGRDDVDADWAVAGISAGGGSGPPAGCQGSRVNAARYRSVATMVMASAPKVAWTAVSAGRVPSRPAATVAWATAAACPPVPACPAAAGRPGSAG